MTHRRAGLLVLVWALALGSPGVRCAAPVGETKKPVWQVLDEAKQQGKDAHGVVLALARLAWSDPPAADPEVLAAAREEITYYGDKGLNALREALRTVEPRFAGDVVATFIAARRYVVAGSPPEYVPGLDDAIWYGSVEAQRIAMQEIVRYKTPRAVLTISDAAHLNPALLDPAIDALALMGDTRARFFLNDVMVHGPATHRLEAARTLGRLGGGAVGMLHQGARSAEPAVHRAAIEAMLPVATVDDLTVLHEYLAAYGSQDAEFRLRLVERIAVLEAELQRTQDAPPGE